MTFPLFPALNKTTQPEPDCDTRTYLIHVSADVPDGLTDDDVIDRLRDRLSINSDDIHVWCVEE